MTENHKNTKWIEFCQRVIKLKTLKRTGWLERKIPAPESVADHSFGVSLLAMIMAKHRNMDASKLISMALLHDLGEYLVGDITPHDREKYEAKRPREEDAVSELLQGVDKSGELLELWRDVAYERTEAGRLIKELDKIEMAFQALFYERQTGISLEEFFNHAQTELEDEELLTLLNRIKEMRIK